MARKSSLVRARVRLARADQIVVDDQHQFLVDQAELANDVRNRPLAIAESAKGRNAAEAAIKRATARCLDRPKRVVAGEQIVAGRRHNIHCRVRTLIKGAARVPCLASSRTRPQTPLGLARHNRVNAGRGLIRAHRGVDTAHDDRNAARAKLSSEFVCAVSLRRERGHARRGPGAGSFS